VLNPTDEATYQLLDDLYSEQAPLLESNLFNVCCDETEGLGTGPAKALAGEIGVGAVYARHVRRIHDLLRDKYGKRMMMWGDIILMHPDKLGMIPKDTIMLSWGYHAAPSFEGAILPFAKSGYEFFVCPGISNWNRILPDTRTATANIQVYVRDGAKHGALGMLNTTWDDEGEQLAGWNWHGIAWGAECAWNASMTAPEDFNRRLVRCCSVSDRIGSPEPSISSAGRTACRATMRCSFSVSGDRTWASARAMSRRRGDRRPDCGRSSDPAWSMCAARWPRPAGTRIG